ncbi:hypothetical protein C8R48DRAFT_746527 [Suillus tomentosus]|nr:hypothetical protein C8R48DRAFT_746527 [Suillus tomentosus]
MKEWLSPVYVFFDPMPHIVEINGQCAHEFKCNARSTGNMQKHIKSCWGEDVLNAADDANNANEVWSKIVPGIVRDGSITASFERKGKGKVIMYSHHQHTHAETKGFLSLMKTGRPEYYLPLPTTISHDVWLGKLNFTINAWTLQNHRAFVAICVHLEHKGIPLSLPLDIIEVAKVRQYQHRQ